MQAGHLRWVFPMRSRTMWNSKFSAGRFNFKLWSIVTFIALFLLITVSRLLGKTFRRNPWANKHCTVFQGSSTQAENKDLTRNFPTVFVSFPVMTDLSYKTENFDLNSKADLENRMLDFIESLQYTLAHPYILEVYLIYDQDVMPAYIKKTVGSNAKLKLVKLRDPYMFLNVFEYVNTNFRNKLVMVTNADIYPDDGLDKVNYDLMKEKRLLYVPTRRGRKEKRCSMFPDQCDLDFKIPGAHDVYMYIPLSPIPVEGQVLLNKTWDTFGMENIILHVFGTLMCYKPVNPCKVISMYHNHCSKLRHKDRLRFDIAPDKEREFAEYSDDLE